MPSPKPIQIVLVEDSARLRESLAQMLAQSPAHRLVGAFADAETALAQIPALRPDVVLMDIGLPRMSGIECVRALKAQMPSLPVLMLTVYDEGPFLFNSLKAGANGYLLKRTVADKLLDAIEEARQGGVPLTRQMAAKIAEYFQQQGTIVAEVETLTRRERETLELLAQGFLYKEIADRLGISLDTVREYVRNIYVKLHVSSRTEAVVKFLGRS
jgi:DNA-binding NarL/FixJ family response regulator